MKEPGQIAMEAYWEPIEVWADIDTDERAAWARVEAAVLEEAAKVAREYGEAFRTRNPTSYGEGYADASDTIERAIRALANRSAAAPASPSEQDKP